MSKVRIYELARELGVENKDVISCAQRLGMTDKTSHSNSLEEFEADSIRRTLLRRVLGEAVGGEEVSGAQAGGGTHASKTVVRRTKAVISRTSGVTSTVDLKPGNVVMRRRRPAQADSDEAEEIGREEQNSQDVEDNLSALFEEGSLTAEEIDHQADEEQSRESAVSESEPQLQEAVEEEKALVDFSTPQESNESDEKTLESIQDGQDVSSLSESAENELQQVNGELQTEVGEIAVGEGVVDQRIVSEGAQEELSTQAEHLQQENVASEENVAESREVAGQEQASEVFGEVSAGSQTAQEETKDEGRSFGPKVLGRIDLPRRAPKSEARATGSFSTRRSKSVDEGEAPFGDEEGGDYRRKGRKGRSKRREFSRTDLLDYDPSEFRKAKGGKTKSKIKGVALEKGAKHEFSGPKASKRVVKIDEAITVGELAKQMSLKAGEVIQKLISLGVMATINQIIDKDTATIVAEEFEYQVESVSFDEDLAIGLNDEEQPENLVSRSPVVTVMGHVDHGKTSLLDSIRQPSVATREHGGITQHIGAYQIELESGRKITFIDTPGHEAFTSMRARGAQVTDIVVLVVAADDGVMPQTIEAINHAKAAEVSIVVALNKMDKVDSNPDRVKQQLSEYGLQPEDWGGDTLFFPVSAIKGDGIPELLDGILLVAELKELQANFEVRASGTVLEASQERGRGTVATVLVQRGCLNLGDIFIAGAEYGRVRSMMNDLGDRLEKVLPSEPVQITGFNGVPVAGDDFIVVDSEAVAREIAENRTERIARAERAREAGPITLEEFSRRTSEATAEELNVILKTDVHGTAEAVKTSIQRLSTEKVRVKVLHSAVGGINESDIQLAVASGAIVVGFGVRGEPRALTLAESLGVEVRFYRVIYNLLDDIEKAMVGLLSPDQEEVALGRVEVRDTFSVPKVGVVAGGYVSDGIVKRGAFVRVVRDSRVIFEGRMGSLRRFKEDVKQVQSGYECGIGVENFNDIKVGDVVEVFEFKEVAPTLH